MPRSRTEKVNPLGSEERDAIRRMMRAYFLALRAFGKTRAATPEELYGFGPSDVSEMHFYRAGAGRGVWYRLKDGRVFDSQGRPSRRDRISYSMKAPKVRTTVTSSRPIAKIGKWTEPRERMPKNRKTG
ncbi:MAG TPA: hypothetical protein VN737_05250 [Bryobacteraceae bacterium]|nr:hypothetical protein [Bryobacteraceae bacterium]